MIICPNFARMESRHSFRAQDRFSILKDRTGIHGMAVTSHTANIHVECIFYGIQDRYGIMDA